MIAVLLFSAIAADSTPDAMAIPQTIRAMLDAAMASGDENAVNTMV